jgi:sensor histidine kinase YesM
MQDNLLPMDDKHFSPRYIVISLLINAVVNTVIAVILTAIGFGKNFITTLIFSQCIGMSVYLANLAAFRLFKTVTRSSRQVIMIVAAVIMGAVVGTVLGALANGFSPLQLMKEYSAFFGQVVLIALLFGAIVSYIFISLAKLSEEKIKRLDMGKNAVETELKFLQSQMEPHFLFNTLSTILSLMDTDREKAKRMLESFTSFLRASFLTARHRTITLGQEMDVVKNYLEVVSVRMGDRLRYSIEVPEDLRSFPVPPLLVQPLVENAVKHGLEPSVRGGELALRALRDNDVVRIIVADSGLGINGKGAGNNVGLGNIRKRLELMYGDRGRLFLEENKPSGVKVVVEMPYETDTSRHR